MGRRNQGLAAACLAAAVLAGCGSSSSSTSSAIPLSSSAQTTPATTQTATTAAAQRKLAALSRIVVHRHPQLRPRFTGLQSLTLTQKIEALANNVGSFWAAELQAGQVPFTPATINVVDQTAARCNANQITTTDPPEYCSGDGSIDFPLAYMQNNVAPIGDAAVALVVSDLYGYHVENALGAFGAGLSAAELQQLDSCLSGVYFYSIQGNLTAGDQAAVNTILAKKAAPTGTPGGLTATDLTSAFNQGILSQGRAQVCLPPKGAPAGP
jgi:hypothetical protein